MKKIRLSKFIETYYWPIHGKDKKSSKSFRVTLNHICNILGKKHLDRITFLDIKTYREIRLQSVKASTVNREHTVLTHIFNMAKKWNRYGITDVKLPSENPGPLVHKVSEKPFVRKRFLTPEALLTLLQNCDRDLQRIIKMAFFTTLRLVDLKTMSKDNVNLETRMLEGIQAKTGKPYNIPITPVIHHIVTSADQGDYILNFKNFRRKFDNARKISKLPYFQFKDLRRSGAKNLEKLGISLKTISEILGHVDLKMTQAYLPTTNIDKEKAIRLLEQQMVEVGVR